MVYSSGFQKMFPDWSMLCVPTDKKNLFGGRSSTEQSKPMALFFTRTHAEVLLPSLSGLAVIALLGLLIPAQPGMAETIHLSDGRVIYGKVTGFEDGVFTIEGAPKPTYPAEDVEGIRFYREGMGGEIQNVTTVTTIPWFGNRLTVVSYRPIAMLEVGLVPRSYGFYIGAQQFFGGRLVFRVTRRLPQVELKMRFYNEKKQVVYSPRITLFNVEPEKPMPFTVNLVSRHPVRFRYATLTLVSTRPRGSLRPDHARGQQMPSIFLDPRALEVPEPDESTGKPK